MISFLPLFYERVKLSNCVPMVMFLASCFLLLPSFARRKRVLTRPSVSFLIRLPYSPPCSLLLASQKLG
jgi:hypothetical protein